MIEYSIVSKSGSSIYEANSLLIAAVNGKATQGWKPQGGVSVVMRQGSDMRPYYCSQALIKDDDK